MIWTARQRERAAALATLLDSPDECPHDLRRGHVWTQPGDPVKQRALRIRLPLLYIHEHWLERHREELGVVRRFRWFGRVQPVTVSVKAWAVKHVRRA